MEQIEQNWSKLVDYISHLKQEANQFQSLLHQKQDHIDKLEMQVKSLQEKMREVNQLLNQAQLQINSIWGKAKEQSFRNHQDLEPSWYIEDVKQAAEQINVDQLKELL